VKKKIIEEYKGGWREISCHPNLSEDFIERFQVRVYWPYISRYQTLSEPFIEKFRDMVDWWGVSCHQTLSEEFYKKHKDKIVYPYSIKAVHHCGKSNRPIYRLVDSPEIIHIGCFEGTKDEAIKAIKEKYADNPVARDDYIKKVEECFE